MATLGQQLVEEFNRVEGEVGTQTDLISQIQAALAGKAVSGSDYLAMRCNNTITEYSSDEVTSVNQYALYGSSNLTSVSFPNATSLGTYAFAYCSKLTDVHLPAVVSVGTNAFSGCYELSFLDLPSATSIGKYVFTLCSSFSTLILRSPTVCALADKNAFNNTKFSGSGGGTVYVPSALIASYQTASNWSTLYNDGSCTFAAIEGSEYE